MRESLTFCISDEAIPDDCITTLPPVVRLGREAGGSTVLTLGELNEDSVFAQISTNAVSGVVVRLKSSALGCGGLLRADNSAGCNIMPALNDGIDPQSNQARFGVRTSPATDTPGMEATAGGVFRPAAGSIYSDTAYALNYSPDDTSGITSTYGDPFLDTGNAPANAKNMKLTFGATISDTTPAGSYYTDLSLIAVGKF